MFNLNAKINNKKILIYGFGKSGQSSYNYLKKLNKVSIFDDYKKVKKNFISKKKVQFLINQENFLSKKHRWTKLVTD